MTILSTLSPFPTAGAEVPTTIHPESTSEVITPVSSTITGNTQSQSSSAHQTTSQQNMAKISTTGEGDTVNTDTTNEHATSEKTQDTHSLSTLSNNAKAHTSTKVGATTLVITSLSQVAASSTTQTQDHELPSDTTMENTKTTDQPSKHLTTDEEATVESNTQRASSSRISSMDSATIVQSTDKVETTTHTENPYSSTEENQGSHHITNVKSLATNNEGVTITEKMITELSKQSTISSDQSNLTNTNSNNNTKYQTSVTTNSMQTTGMNTPKLETGTPNSPTIATNLENTLPVSSGNRELQTSTFADTTVKVGDKSHTSIGTSSATYSTMQQTNTDSTASKIAKTKILTDATINPSEYDETSSTYPGTSKSISEHEVTSMSKDGISKLATTAAITSSNPVSGSIASSTKSNSGISTGIHETSEHKTTVSSLPGIDSTSNAITEITTPSNTVEQSTTKNKFTTVQIQTQKQSSEITQSGEDMTSVSKQTVTSSAATEVKYFPTASNSENTVQTGTSTYKTIIHPTASTTDTATISTEKFPSTASATTPTSSTDIGVLITNHEPSSDDAGETKSTLGNTESQYTQSFHESATTSTTGTDVSQTTSLNTVTTTPQKTIPANTDSITQVLTTDSKIKTDPVSSTQDDLKTIDTNLPLSQSSIITDAVSHPTIYTQTEKPQVVTNTAPSSEKTSDTVISNTSPQNKGDVNSISSTDRLITSSTFDHSTTDVKPETASSNPESTKNIVLTSLKPTDKVPLPTATTPDSISESISNPTIVTNVNDEVTNVLKTTTKENEAATTDSADMSRATTIPDFRAMETSPGSIGTLTFGDATTVKATTQKDQMSSTTMLESSKFTTANIDGSFVQSVSSIIAETKEVPETTQTQYRTAVTHETTIKDATQSVTISVEGSSKATIDDETAAATPLETTSHASIDKHSTSGTAVYISDLQNTAMNSNPDSTIKYTIPTEIKTEKTSQLTSRDHSHLTESVVQETTITDKGSTRGSTKAYDDTSIANTMMETTKSPVTDLGTEQVLTDVSTQDRQSSTTQHMETVRNSKTSKSSSELNTAEVTQATSTMQIEQETTINKITGDSKSTSLSESIGTTKATSGPSADKLSTAAHISELSSNKFGSTHHNTPEISTNDDSNIQLSTTDSGTISTTEKLETTAGSHDQSTLAAQTTLSPIQTTTLFTQKPTTDHESLSNTDSTYEHTHNPDQTTDRLSTAAQKHEPTTNTNTDIVINETSVTDPKIISTASNIETTTSKRSYVDTTKLNTDMISNGYESTSTASTYKSTRLSDDVTADGKISTVANTKTDLQTQFTNSIPTNAHPNLTTTITTEDNTKKCFNGEVTITKGAVWDETLSESSSTNFRSLVGQLQQLVSISIYLKKC